MRNASLFGAAFVTFIGSGAAQAQPVTPPIAPPTREEITRPPSPQSELPAPRLTVEGGVERAPCALDRPEYEALRFTPTEVSFENLRGLSPEQLRAAYEPYLGQEQPLRVVCEIRDRAATILREAGYVASVEVPEQRIADGRLRFQVLMAKMVGLRVRGDAGRAERLIASYLEPLTRQEVFNRNAAERHLLLAGDIPGYVVRLNLVSAGAARGEVIGEVTVLRSPSILEANVQNLGSRDLGRWGAMLRGQLFGLTGLGDRTTLTAYSTLDFEEQQTVQLVHDFRVGGSGLGFGGQVTYAVARPDLADSPFDIRADTLFASLETSYPIIRGQSQTLRVHAGLELVNQDVDFNALALTRDRLRVAFLRLEGETVSIGESDRRYTIIEPRWRGAILLEARRGLDIFGASPNCASQFALCTAAGRVPPSRFEGDPTATVLRASMLGEFRPVPRVTTALSARAQYSANALLSFEEFSAGNYTVGRGYDPGALIGDSGVGVQAELRLGSLLPSSGRRYAIEPYVFLDQAWVWNEDRIGIVTRHAELTSVGGGIRANLDNRFRLDVAVAVPLDRLDAFAERPDARVLVSLTARLWPWSL